MAQQSQRFINFINQQLEILRGERQTVIDALDQYIDQFLSEVNAWVNGGHVNHTTYAEMNNRIQQVIHMFMAKSAEISASNNSTIPTTSGTRGEVRENRVLSGEERVNESGVVNNNTALKLAILERAVYSLKKSTKDQQEHVNKHFEMLNNAHLNSEKEFQERFAALEKTGQEISSRVDHLFEAATDFGGKLTRLEEDNKSSSATLNELNQQIRSVRTFSSDALMSIQDLSKSVESTNQQYNEMSNKTNQMEISINLMSSQYTERFEALCRFNNDKTDAFEKAFENRVAKLTNTVTEIDRKNNLPNAGFYAWTSLEVTDEWCDVESFDSVSANYGNHFDPPTGKFTAPLNGLYLMSIRTGGLETNDSFGATCYQKSSHPLHQGDDGVIELCDVVGNQTMVRCSELAAGDVVYLQSKSFERNTNKCISIYFSIYMIKC